MAAIKGLGEPGLNEVYHVINYHFGGTTLMGTDIMELVGVSAVDS